METKKISELNATYSLNTNDEIPIVQNGETKKTNVDTLSKSGKNIVTFYMNITEQTGQTYALPSTGYVKVPLNAYILIGDAFTLQSNQIKIKSGVNHIKVSAQVHFNSVAGTNNKFATIFKNNTAVVVGVKNISARDTINISEYVLDVVENDVISLQINALQGDEIRRGYYTYLTVEVID